MKRLSTFLGCIVAVGVLTACSGNDSSEDVGSEAHQEKVSAFVDACGVQSAPDGNLDLVPAEELSGQVELNFVTNFGNIPMVMDADKAPCAVSVINQLAKSGFYDQTQCHRITNLGFYILQCGDPTGTSQGGPGFTFADEYPVGTSETGLYKAGTVAMANAGENTNGSQFFFNYKDSELSSDYTIFGTVTEEGMATLKAIGDKGAVDGASDGAPAEAVIIESVS